MSSLRGRSWASAARPGRCAETACAPLSSCRTRRRPSGGPGHRPLGSSGHSERRPAARRDPPPAPPPPRIPRRITLRVVLFILLIAAVPTAAYFAIRWYAYDNWYLSVQKHEIVVNQGHPAESCGSIPGWSTVRGRRHHNCSPATWPRSAPGAGALAAGGEALCGQPSQRVRQRAEREAPHDHHDHHDRCSGNAAVVTTDLDDSDGGTHGDDRPRGGRSDCDHSPPTTAAVPTTTTAPTAAPTTTAATTATTAAP